ncbi:hypothetical protein [Devosia alba]|uniref:hypothetical protein n=1 Tax=Devosia alba TaxID=3152360 RepID=UPI003265985C
MQQTGAMLVLAGLLLSGPALGAERYGDPKALVSAIYAEYQPGAHASAPNSFYSQRLQGIYEQAVENNVFADDAAVTGAPFVAAQMFNPFLPDASALLFDLSVGEATISGDRAIINVSYHNFDHPRLLAIATVREADGWKVDDVAALGPDDHWLLSWALTYDPLGF